ncbi:uncharacterized protein LOC112126238 [Cimex lectularius]|uniref:Integrase catalytic domain-containing protein n=1 Tax=Cimex lectularius TaxID=79782 RepID=A0A8I6SG28_CIMLE|nr:uncharacterized protein LOC112126238 [Cimex lectularius]
MTVLSWIRLPLHRLKTFVANRISIIQEPSNDYSWFHVASANNAADVASRGESPSNLVHLDSWWLGPSWIRLPINDWPIKSLDVVVGEDLPEIKSETVLLSLDKYPSPFIELIDRSSSYSKLIRIMAYVIRFTHNCRVPADEREYSFLELSELRNASTCLYVAVQKELTTKIHSDLKSLAPFIDSKGVLRVGGRLTNAPLSDETKRPILLPSKSHFVELLIDHVHVTNLHAGPQLLHAILRQNYWIISARRVVKTRVHQCLRCHRLRTQGFTPYMGDLPLTRFEQGRAFINVGTDFAGPFFIRESLRRKAAVGKAYVCLFVCFSTKAMHIEIVSQLTTDAFLATLDRFISRRGLPSQIFSDHGRNFLGAQRKLQELQRWWKKEETKEKICHHLHTKGIKWTFIPPHAPNFGGLWEAGVKSIKTHLSRVVGQQHLTFEELTTLACRVEAILNSRPLYPLSTDPEDYDVLTPGHFLIGAPLVARIERDVTQTPSNRLLRWQLLNQHIQSIWKKWRFDYIHNLQQRTKWTKTENVEEGTLILLKEDNTPPLLWPIGRITACYPGKDGVIRVAKIKTPHTSLIRPLSKLAPLLPPNPIDKQYLPA